MKNIRTISKYLAFAGIAFAMVVSATGQQVTRSTAKVVRIKGAAQYATANNVWQPLKVGDTLGAGAIIQTAAASRVDLVLGNKDAIAVDRQWGDTVPYQPVVEQDFVRVWENSVMAIDKLSVAETGADRITETHLDLRSGKIFGTVKKLSAGSKYEIKIPNGVAGIRGTIYTISSLGVFSLTSGSGVIAYKDGAGNVVTQVVVAGQSYDCRTGQFTPIPQYLAREMRDACGDSSTGHHEPVKHFPDDHNHDHHSPTQGHNDQGEDNDDQGNNQGKPIAR